MIPRACRTAALGLALLTAVAGCSKKPGPAGQTPEQVIDQALAASQVSAAVTVSPASGAPEQVAGYIFGVPVPVGNYAFAKRVAYMFPRPWEEGLAEADRERAIWEALILHYESFRRGVSLSEPDMETKINEVLKSQQQAFARSGDAAAYQAWVTKTVGEDVELFENQMRYLFQIEKLKDQMRESFPVTVSEEELQQEFLNEQHHVSGEMVTFDAKDDAQAFYETVKEPSRWEAMKAAGERTVRPVNLMTLEAYIDLWSVPKEQVYALHALPLGAVGAPMPFGKQWCVYRLLDKRTGDPAELSKQHEAYVQQLNARKRHEALKGWVEELKASAKLRILPISPPATPAEPPAGT